MASQYKISLFEYHHLFIKEVHCFTDYNSTNIVCTLVSKLLNSSFYSTISTLSGKTKVVIFKLSLLQIKQTIRIIKVWSLQKVTTCYCYLNLYICVFCFFLSWPCLPLIIFFPCDCPLSCQNSCCVLASFFKIIANHLYQEL